MKIHVEIDCTPEEARVFFGLPDVQPMQAAVMKELQARMLSSMQAMDPETLVKTWMPAGMRLSPSWFACTRTCAASSRAASRWRSTGCRTWSAAAAT